MWRVDIRWVKHIVDDDYQRILYLMKEKASQQLNNFVRRLLTGRQSLASKERYSDAPTEPLLPNFSAFSTALRSTDLTEHSRSTRIVAFPPWALSGEAQEYYSLHLYISAQDIHEVVQRELTS